MHVRNWLWLGSVNGNIDSIYKWAGPSEKGAYGFSNIMWANDLDDVIYDVTIGNIQYATQTFL